MPGRYLRGALDCEMHCMHVIVIVSVLLSQVRYSLTQTICPTDTYKIPELDVIHMCGASQNVACRVTMSSYWAGEYSEYNGPHVAVDQGATTYVAFTKGGSNGGPNWLRVDLLQERTISKVKLRYGDNNMINGQIIIGNAAVWSDNVRSHTYIGTYGLTYTMSPMRQGRYIFVIMPIKTQPASSERSLQMEEINAYMECQNCPLYSTSLAGSTNISQCKCSHGFQNNLIDLCVACPASKYGFDGTCLSCAAGTYNNKTGQTYCQNCTANSYSTPGSILCQCNMGFTGADGSLCTLCAAGTYKNIVGSTMCQSCRDGSSSDPGSISNTSCVCQPGFTGNSSCIACVAGTYKAMLGSALCDACQVDTSSLTGSITVSACQCNPGYTGTDQCTPCAPYTYKTTRGSASCQHRCNISAPSLMAATLCQALSAGSDIHTHSAAPLGTTQLVRYTFADSWGC